MPRPKGGYKANGEQVPGVTTIIGRFKDSGALLYWAFDQGKAAERGEIERLYDRRDLAADAGTLAHLLVENFIDGKPDLDLSEHTEEVKALAKQGFENYRAWAANNRIEIYKQEVELSSVTYRYGGCIDAIGYDSKGALCLVDWKTSNGCYPDYVIQLAAYRNLWEENNPDQPITGGFHLCRFSKENADFTHHYWQELGDAWEQFKLFRAAYDLDKKIKKRMG
jgi:hypothetical protein